ncbi:MAG: ABC-F type ribosomal protection protein CplR [Turicibacter sp.]
MPLISIDKVKKYYSDRLVLDIDHFEMLENERIGLVGVNGAGKTTLLKAIINQIEIDEGQIYLTDSYAYVTQNEDCELDAIDGKIKSMLNAPDTFKNHLSGGEKVKLRIAHALQEQKKLMIADEPTSNLDQESIKILEEMFKNYRGGLLLVSHDRQFLDALCHKIIEIEAGKITLYPGNYTTYLELKDKEHKRQHVEFLHYVSERNRLEEVKIKKMNLRDGIKKAPKRMGNSEARLHKMGDQSAKKNLDGHIKAIQSRIDKLEVKEKPRAINQIKINVQEGMEIISKNVVEVNDLTLSIKDHVLLNQVSFKVKRNKKIALVGKNGCGKSTLIKEIIQNNNKAISINPRVKIGYFDQSQHILDHEKSILDNIKASSSFNETFIRINLNLFGFKGDEVYKKVKVLSGGEKVKVALCKIVLEDNNFLILDEPTNYLDIVSLGALEDALIYNDKTMLIVSHDRTFINKVCDYIIEISNQNVIEFNGSYDRYLEEKKTKKMAKVTDKNQADILILENKLTQVISLLCLETNTEKKRQYEAQYDEILANIKRLKENLE